MNSRSTLAAAAAVALACVCGRLLVAHGQAAAQTPAAESRSRVNLTIYNDDFSLVHEVRPQEIAKGSNNLQLTNISNQLDPQSVMIDWKAEGDLPQIVAQSYDLGISSQQALASRFLGKQVEMVRYGMNGQEAERQTGTLMAQDANGVVLQSKGSLYLNPPGTIVTPASGDIATTPRLAVQVESGSPEKADLDLTYLTRGISWSADYVATISPLDDTMALDCWATVLNKTGVDYPNANVSLVTGSPNRAAVEGGRMAGGFPEAEEAKSTAHGTFVGGSFADGRSARLTVSAPVATGELHAYPVTKPTSLIQNRMNRLLMLSSAKVNITRDYNTRPPQISAWDDGFYWGPPRRDRRGTVAFTVSFINSEKNGLALPLPHGSVRLYEPGPDGSPAYVGAADVPDTPENERLDLTLATVFDLFTEWRTVKQERPEKHTVRKTIELKLHNEKSVDVVIRVVQGFGGRWKIVEEPLKHTALDSWNVQWMVPVKAHSTQAFSYKVDLRI